MHFGSTLASERRRIGISQHRLASDADTTQRHLSFVETGRSRPTRQFVMRLCEALNLAPGRRRILFEAAGFTSPYRARDLGDAEIARTLDLVEKRILANWPFGAFALTPEWNILLANGPGAALLGTTPEALKAEPINFFDILLSDPFRQRIRNWDEYSAAIYARMHRHALANPEFRPRLDDALENGKLSADLDPLAERTEIPAILPIEIIQPDGSIQRGTSLSAHFTSVHDDIVSGLEIELMVPID